MSELDDALLRLERAVARLEAAAAAAPSPAADATGAFDIVPALGARIDAALARLGRLLDRED